ncbi:cytochrome P450 4V2-like [Cimex lectularius]|uniref:Cytochrome P450 n=1 Tax=Cimex lectularius TaxID=79782 RepID=A0A8I6SIB4_CIMLE|nr:cytochrome P450 4V2-like [Cimex lectularius]
MNLIVLLAEAVLLIIILCIKLDIVDYIRNAYYLNKLPGPPMLPIIGWTFKLAFMKIEDLINFLVSYIGNKYHVAKCWIAGTPVVILLDPEDLEKLLGSMQYITKGTHYNHVKTWLNEGLLTSSGEKWHSRRKTLTPTFHFKILEDSLLTMNKGAKIFAKKLLELNGEKTQIAKLVNLCTLDIVSESAMGVNLEAQHNKSSQYVSDIAEISEIIMKRILCFWLYKDFTFYLTPTGFRFKKVLQRLHTFTQNVITERKEIHEKEITSGLSAHQLKKRKAFLDCLIELEINNPGIFTEEDMREEVDTFLFEGHDTTSAAIVHAMMFVGSNPEVQERLSLEMEEIFGDSDRDVTYSDLQKMHYLENVIKETLRFLPSVPIFTRILTQDYITTKGFLVPRSTNILICPLAVHFAEHIYHNATKFDPDRFNEENVRKRHPFAYIPFSAGPRNCIGQKFAMMEMKVVLSTAIRYNYFHSHSTFENTKFSPLLIVRAHKPIIMHFTPRKLGKINA